MTPVPIPSRPIVSPAHHSHHHCTCEVKSEKETLEATITYGVGYGLIFIGFIISLIGMHIDYDKNKSDIGWRIEQIGIFIMFFGMFSPIIVFIIFSIYFL